MLSGGKNSIYSDELISATELNRQPGRVLDIAQERPVTITRNDRPSVRQKSLIQKSKVQKRYKPLDCRASLATLRDLFMENEKYVFREECNQVILRPYYKPRPPRIANGASRFIYGVLTFDF